MGYTPRSIYILTKHPATRRFRLNSKEPSAVQGSEVVGEACEGWSRGGTWAEVNHVGAQPGVTPEAGTTHPF